MSDGLRQPILLGFDGSAGARAAIDEAGRLFGNRPAVVLTVWESAEAVAPAATLGMPAAAAGEAMRRLDAAASEQAEKLAGEGAKLACAAGLTARQRTRRAERSVAVTLCRCARELEAGVVVVGSRGLSGIKSALLGSVSSGVIRDSERPTLVVPVPDERRGER